MLPELRPEAQDLIARVKDFIEQDCIPSEHIFHDQIEEGENRWNSYPKVINELKDKAKSKGLWNLFLPESEFGAGLTNYEYAHLAEVMGTCSVASEAMNCAAPDTGNMEVIARYGNEKHQEEWLQPLLDGEIRSAFAMTEPGVGSSDATNMQATAVLEGDEYVINGEKWWTSGAGDPRCKILVFMAVTNPDAAKHQRHSMMLVPMESEGIEIQKMMHVFGYDDAPHGHAHIKFNNVRIPKDNLLLGEGRGFEIAQGRLGPGRIHHCMRTIGVGEKAIELMCKRGIDPTKMPFGKNIANLGANFDYIAESRIELNAARLLTLLLDNVRLSAIIKAMMPGGSVIGCPKINTLKLLNKEEKEPRRIYTGSFGYFRSKEDMSFNIIIRSILNFKKNNEVFAASGVILDSTAKNEYHENYLKAKSLLDLLK